MDAWEWVWRCAGVLGVDPLPLTLRQLVWMVEGRHESAWNHTAALLCMAAEIHRDREERSEPFAPREFHPLYADIDDDYDENGNLTEAAIVRREKEMRELAKALGATGV